MNLNHTRWEMDRCTSLIYVTGIWIPLWMEMILKNYVAHFHNIIFPLKYYRHLNRDNMFKYGNTIARISAREMVLIFTADVIRSCYCVIVDIKLKILTEEYKSKREKNKYEIR